MTPYAYVDYITDLCSTLDYTLFQLIFVDFNG